MNFEKSNVSRRSFLQRGGLGLVGLMGLVGLGRVKEKTDVFAQGENELHSEHVGAGMVGQVDHEANQFDPHEILTDFDYGELIEGDDGQTIRRWKIVAINKEFEIAPGIFFPGWVYGSATSAASVRADHIVGQCPGPTLRCIEGERLQIEFVNASDHPHTIHFHGIHAAFMDGIPGVGRGNINPGETFVYEFDAKPFGCHLYHCHALPLNNTFAKSGRCKGINPAERPNFGKEVIN